jgi:hypothetical protein
VVKIQGTIDWHPVWSRLLICAEQLKFRQVRLDIEDPSIGESFHARVGLRASIKSEHSRELKIVFPLEICGRVIGRVEARGDRAGDSLTEIVNQLTKVVHEMERMAGEFIAISQGSPHGKRLVDERPPRELQPVIGVAASGGLV